MLYYQFKSSIKNENKTTEACPNSFKIQWNIRVF